MSMRLCVFALVAIGVTLSLVLNPAARAMADGLETKVLAAYLYNFTRFVEWPPSTSDELRLCVWDDPEVTGLLQALAKRRSQGRPLRVLAAESDAPSCQLLYFGADTARVTERLGALRGKPVLTVSAQPDFIARGGMIGFYRAEGKLKVEINPRAVEQAGLRVSAKLMEVAHVVEKWPVTSGQ